ncbi:MAG: aminopeptidase [Clostridia bacterium]|nr:hypothetical protein [Clostridiales bacterium]MDK2985284.1 aminopeptidase [Clostridia bacterium]
MELKQIALQTLKNCMAVKEGEEVVVVVDSPLKKIGENFLEAAKELKSEAVLVEFMPRENNGEEPPPAVAGAMKNGDVLMLITSRSLSHTKARHAACKAGARVASMPMVTEDMIKRTLALDYAEMKETCDRYADFLTGANEVHLTTPAGTDLTFSIAGREGQSDSGILHNKGDFGNLPAGEAFIAPVEGSAKGTIVIDGSMAGVGLVDEPIKIKVKNGLAIEITGGESAKKLSAIVEKYGEKARNIAELGIGVNPQAKLTGFTLEDEKIAGSCHIALGDNSTFGGNVSVDSHLDGVILKPTLVIDGKKLIDSGKLSLSK